MEVHAVSGGWVLEWSGFTGSSIVKATVGVAGFLVVASGVVQGVRHRSLRWYSHEGRLATDNNKEPDAAVSNQETKELIESAIQAPDNQRVEMATARASDLPKLIVSGADSPRSRIGRGLESIGGMTAETLQRISSTVGGVVKSPVVLMAKVGGLASPRATTLTAPPGSSLEERVYHLEIQMKSLEEKFNSMTVVTELDLSTRLHKEKPQIAKSLLQEMEMDMMLEKRVQMLEDRVNERMERFEKALSNIQSRLDHIDFSKRESVAGYERQKSLSSEPQYYDAEQQSDNFEALETVKKNFLGAHGVLGDITGGSLVLEKSCVKETSSIAPTIVEYIEPLQEIDAGKNHDFFEPQVSTPSYSKEALLTEPMESTTPSSQLAISVHRDDYNNLPASSDLQLASTLEELHGSFVTEASATAASAKFLEIARAVTIEKSTLAHASLELQSTSVLEESREAFLEEPSTAIPIAKLEEHTQEDDADKSGATMAIVESPLPPTFEATQKDFTKESLATTPNVKLTKELETQGVVSIAFASSERPVTSKFVEEPLVVVPIANFEEPSHEDIGDKNVNMIATRESPKAFAFQDPQEDFVKESLASAPGVGPAHNLSSQEDSSTTNDVAFASSESPMASKSMEKPSTIALGANFEEPIQEDAISKSGNMIATAELPLASSLEEPQEKIVKEFMAAAPNVESTQVLKTQEDNDMQVIAFESQMTSKFVEEPSIVAPSVDFEEVAQEDVVDKTGTTMATTKSSLASSLEESKEGFEKESMAFALSGEPTQEHSDMAIASSEIEGASKFVEEVLVATPSDNFGERGHKIDANKSGTIIASVESPLVSSFGDLQETFEKEFLATTPSAGPIHEPSSQECLGATSDKALASLEPQLTSKFVEEPSSVVQSANFDESAREDDVDKSVTITATANSLLASSYQGSQEDFGKESLTAAPSDGPIHKPSSLEDSGATSDVALASFDPLGGSKFVEESSLDIPSANFEEPTQEDGAAKSDTVIVDVKSPLASSFEKSQEDFEKESMVAILNTEPTQELATQEESGIALASFEPKVASKFVEETSIAIPNADLQELAHEDATNKSVIMTTPRKDPHEDFVKESLATLLNVGPIHELLTQEDLDGTSDIAFTSSTPHLASKFVEKPSPTILSANSEELTHDEDVVKSDNISSGIDSPLASSFEESQEDFEKEPLATTSSHNPIQGLAIEDDSHMAPKSFESQEASKSVEELSAIVPNADFEEPTHEDAVDKSVAMTVVGVSPFTSLFEVPHDDSKKESITTALSIEHAQELTTQEDSDTTPSKPQVASKFVEESSASDVPSAKFEECVHEDTIDMSNSVTAGVESPSVSSLKAHMEDYTKESLAAGANAKVLETIEEDESGKSPIAFAPLEAPSTSFFEIPQKKSLKEPSRTSIQVEEFAQEKSGIVLLDANSTLTLTMEEGNHAAKEVEYKLAEDFKIHHEHIKSIDKEFPSIPSNLDHISSNESLAMEDNDVHLESDQSGEEFFDAEYGSGNFKPWEFDEPQSFEEFGIGSDESEQQSIQELGHKPEQQHAQELEQEDLTRISAMALPPLDLQVSSKSGESQELLAEEPLVVVPSTKFDEQANAADKSATRDLPLTSTMEEPHIDTDESPKKSLSSASFHQSSNPELLENLEYKCSDIQGTSSIPQEALEREPLTTAPTMKVAHGSDARKNDSVQISLESQLEESKEALANEPMKVVPSSESIEPAQKVDDGQCSAILAFPELQLTLMLEEPHEGFVKEPLVDAESAFKFVDSEESLADKPLAVTSAKLAQESNVGKIDAGLVEELPLTPIAEDPHNGNVSSLVEGKLGQDATDQKFLEDVKIITESIEEAIPRTQGDLTHIKLNPEAVEDATILQGQGNFLALGATLVDSKDALVKEPLPSSKLLELLEEENNSGKKERILADFPMTSTVEEPQKPLAEDPLASAKSVPKGHARRRGFAHSSSEPQFAYELEEHRKALAKESSVVAIPSASKLGEGYAQEDFGDTQCLPFKILGEGKHPRKESEFNRVEDVKSPVTKSEITSSSYVLEPKPSKIKEKKKKEKKEKKPDATAEEKERRLSLGLGEIERKSSLRAKEKDSKYSPRAEEKHKQPFRHLRDRLRHAFSVNKEP